MDGNQISTLSRRRFLVTGVTAAGGFAIGISALPHLAHAVTVAAQPWNDEEGHNPREIDAWIAIDPDDSILIRYQRSEMGQGSMTALPMLINEELQADWSKIRIEYASPNRNIREHKIYGDMNSNGSRSVRASQQKMQQVGASARVRLIQAAATKWGVPASECSSANSVITHVSSGRTIRYGEVAADAAQIKLDKEPVIKTPDQFTFAGKPMPRVDVAHKIDGSGKYGMDAQVPGMVFAAIVQCPVAGGKLKNVDASVIAGMPGNPQVVKLDDAVAVVADGSWWRARQALAKLQPDWDVGAAGDTDSAQLSKEFRAALDGQALVAQNQGDVDKALSGDAKIHEAVYETPYLSHSPMEPMNATVHLQADRLDVWVGTQDAREATEAAAKAAGMEAEKVYVHNGYVGGGFGRRDANDEVKQAIAIAKVVNKPVKLIWSREEDTRHDKYRPHAVVRFRAALGSDGMPTALATRAVTSSILNSAGRPSPAKGPEPQAVAGLADIGYTIPNSRVDAIIKNTHLPVWFWRAPGANQNVFAIESFIDELALAAGQDPYQYRRKLLAGKPDWLKVLDAAAEKGDWGKPLPKGTGRGMAICTDTDSLCAQVAEVTVSPKGEVHVDRVTVALDTRYQVNPLSIAEQAEGSVIFNLSAVLYGKIEVKNGAVVQGNFDTYRMVRLAQAPKIDVVLVPSGGSKWGGAGEPATPPIAGAVANAIFAATGKRIRTLPVMDTDLSAST
ncbi:MAG TPA: molybdopterin cofactor-binding domain-containing protein [Stellaceae bacterium]|jgi:isoquinoline 1-oxidoreductase beta subunit|nr:molybdopterin cofactor-binding domain-containing protein [Stellaceae bacterium]